MEVINCECGKTYQPQDIYAKNRHETTTSHVRGVEQARLSKGKPVETFADLDLDDPVEKPKRTRKTKVVEDTAQSEIPIKKAKTPRGVGAGEHKVCRICGKDKPLTDFGVKSSRPDGRQTLCTSCAHDWTVAHKAKKAASA